MALTIANADAAERFIAFTPEKGYWKADICNMRILVDRNEDKAILHALENLKNDISMVCGERVEQQNVFAMPNEQSQNLFETSAVARQGLMKSNGSGIAGEIIVGTLDSPLLSRFLKGEIIKREELKGKWEKYVIVPIAAKGNRGASIIIAGSDRRGCVYGIYELSRQLGVSPWYWWADIPVVHREDVYLKEGCYTDGEPKVKYRGIFINDENPCMQKWARLKFGGMNSKMYFRVYELLLRMKANLLWPGMWGTFKEYKPLVPVFQNPDGTNEGNCFNWDDPENPRLADEMGVIVGTSHHEPMQRSQQEWVRTRENYGNGQWNYLTNEQGLKKFFQEGIENTKDFDCMITVGMRGEEDRPMEDAGGREENMRLLRKIFNDQRTIINRVMGKRAKEVPLVWTLYSEMLDYYEDGFQIPEDVIVMLCDNNWGDIRKIPVPNSGKQTKTGKGGYGMYYHFSYYGGPRAMKWLQQMQIQQVWHQMDLAYRSGIDKVWITNVGDIKPAEFMTQFFMDMAWNPEKFNHANLTEYTEHFCRQFAGKHSYEAARILSLYNKYASRQTAEMLDEKTFSLTTGEWKQVRDEFMALEAEALRLKEEIAPNSRDAYNQIILYPVQALANLYDMYFSLAMNRFLAERNDSEANVWGKRVEYCFKRDSLLTHFYNKVMKDGKWDGIMEQVHIGYTSWHAPQFNTMPSVSKVEEGEKMTGGYVFEEHGGEVIIDARHFFSVETPEGMDCIEIPWLGKISSAIEIRPLSPLHPMLCHDGNGGFGSLSYRFVSSCPKEKMKVRVVFSSVMPFIKGGHNVEMAFEGCEPVVRNLNKDMNWKHCYDLMYPAGAARVIEVEVELQAKPIEGNVYQLNIRPLAPGLVFQRVVIDLGGYQTSLLHGIESSYRK